MILTQIELCDLSVDKRKCSEKLETLTYEIQKQQTIVNELQKDTTHTLEEKLVEQKRLDMLCNLHMYWRERARITENSLFLMYGSIEKQLVHS